MAGILIAYEKTGYTIEKNEKGGAAVSATGVVFITLHAPQRPEYIEIDSERYENLSEERRCTFEHHEDGWKFFSIDPEGHRAWKAYDKAYLRLSRTKAGFIAVSMSAMVPCADIHDRCPDFCF